MLSRVGTFCYLKYNFQQQKCNIHAKKKKTGKVWGNKLLIETISIEAKMLDLEWKNIKSTVANTFKELKETISKELKECMRKFSYKIMSVKRYKVEKSKYKF